ncbi:zinc finger protein 532-like protein, partial [Dinothrombium tinctorium]
MKKSTSETFETSKSANSHFSPYFINRDAYQPSVDAPKFDLTGKPLERYRCNECGDTFLFESSLNEHRNRKSVSITYNCSLCKKLTTVYNHTAKHKQDHYDDGNGSSFQCEICTLWCPSSCSLQAHRRLHTGSKPYICPECGHELNSLQKLTVHTLMKCQHLFRHIVYNCPFCCSIIKAFNSLIEHIVDYHTKVSLQCGLCLLKFDSDSDLETHKKTAHINDAVVKQIKLYKCQQCSAEVSSKVFYFTHIESHMKELQNVARFQFSCPQCNDRLCASKNQLLVHLKAAHLLDLRNSSKVNEHLVNCMTKDLCVRFRICCNNESIAENDIKTNGELKSSSEKHFTCETCTKTTATREEMFNHGKMEHTNTGLSVCLICFNKNMGSEEALLRHLNVIHGKESKCPLSTCNNLKFGGAYTVLDHFIEKHGLINRLDSKDDETNSDINRSEEPFSKRTKCSNSKYFQPLNGNVSHKLVDGRNGTNGFRRNVTCSQCGHNFMDEEQLRLHVNVHKTDKAPFLCYECGSSFVVAPSFKRHLQIEHKIENGNEYIAKYLPELYELITEKPVDVISIIHDEALTDSICPVCKMACANSTDLKTH